jgi:hypothetical protein
LWKSRGMKRVNGFVSIYLPTYLSIYLSARLSVYLSVCQSMYLSICLLAFVSKTLNIGICAYIYKYLSKQIYTMFICLHIYYAYIFICIYIMHMF